MPIVIEKVDDMYRARVSPPHGGGEPWSTVEPLPRDGLIEALRALGCHQTDIGDAFFAADPGWVD
ncbi:MAG: hypothetical protein JOY58_19320 [Solirubrobacterales bacterium]|nr:hypothetical protein [Solirubrobacterales bacterium]